MAAERRAKRRQARGHDADDKSTAGRPGPAAGQETDSDDASSDDDRTRVACWRPKETTVLMLAWTNATPRPLPKQARRRSRGGRSSPMRTATRRRTRPTVGARRPEHAEWLKDAALTALSVPPKLACRQRTLARC